MVTQIWFCDRRRAPDGTVGVSRPPYLQLCVDGCRVSTAAGWLARSRLHSHTSWRAWAERLGAFGAGCASLAGTGAEVGRQQCGLGAERSRAAERVQHPWQWMSDVTLCWMGRTHSCSRRLDFAALTALRAEFDSYCVPG